jgi:hypothetical protein
MKDRICAQRHNEEANTLPGVSGFKRSGAGAPQLVPARPGSHEHAALGFLRVAAACPADLLRFLFLITL